MIDLFLRLSDHDQRVLHALLVRRVAWLDRVMATVTHLGGATFSIALALVLLAGFVPRMARAGLAAAFALALSHAGVQLIKRSVVRPRPELPVGLESLVRAPDRFSFPSGHAAASLSVALPIAAALGGVTGFVVLVLGLSVGFSRCYLGVHYPGDVIAGWLLALAGLWAGTLIGL